MQVGVLKKMLYLFLLISALQGLTTCGLMDNDSKKSSGEETFDGLIPEGWDLKSDWDSSDWEVKSL